MLAKRSFLLSHKKLIISLVVVLIVGIIAFVFFSKRKDGPRATYASTRDTYVATKGNISKSITGSGVIKSSNTKNISSEVAADILEVNVSVGDKVSKGDILFKLDTTTLDAQIRSQEKNINNFLKSVNSYKEDIKNLNVYATSSGYVSDLNYKVGDDINKNSTLFKLSNDDYYYLECSFYYNSTVDIAVGNKATLFLANSLVQLEGEVSFVSDHKSISDDGSTLQTVEIKISNPGYTIAGLSALTTVHTGTIDIKSTDYETIEESDYITIKALSSGTIDALNIHNGDYIDAGELIMTLSNDDLYEDLETAQSNLNDAYEDLSDIKETYDFYTITSPIDGVITSINIAEGDYVRSESELATIINNQNLEFDISVDELEILDVELGQEVKITVDALDETESTPLIGYVSEIAFEGTSSNSVTTYPVTISLSGDDNIKIGFNCSAEIITTNVEDVIIAPVEAISTRRNKYFVTLEDGTEKEVTVGLYNEDYIEISSGLEVGDVIMLPTKVSGSSETTTTGNSNSSFSFPGGGGMSGFGGQGMPSNMNGGMRGNAGGMMPPGGF